MKLLLTPKNERTIGALKVPLDMFAKIEAIAKNNSVTNQDVVRAIVASVIDSVE